LNWNRRAKVPLQHGAKPKIFIGYSVAITKTGRHSNLQRNQLLLGAPDI